MSLNVVPIAEWLLLRTRFNDIVAGERDYRISHGNVDMHDVQIADAVSRYVLAELNELRSRLETAERHIIEAAKGKAPAK